MSLLYWLPLTNDIKNQGVGVLGSPTFNTLTQMDDGKIGKCYKNRCVFPINDEFDNKWTIACWFKQIRALGTSNTILITQTTSNAGDGAFYFSVYLDSSTNKMNTRLGVNEYSTITCELPESPEIDEWFHMAATYDGTTYKIYYNGSLIKQGTKTSTKQSGTNIGLGCRSSGTGGDHYYCFNDVRIYNHVLSEREIRLLAQALLVHYPLCFPGQPNIVKNTNTRCGNGYQATLTTQNNVLVPEWGTENATRVYGTRNGSNTIFYVIGGGGYINGSPYTVDGQKYSSSVYIKNNYSSGNIRITTNVTDGQVGYVYPGESKKVTLHWVGNGSQYIQNNINTDQTNFDITLYHPKIELGEYSTPWIPATSDPEYHTMGFDSNIGYDVSGLENNMTMYNIEVSSDTPRYHTSYVFNGANGYCSFNQDLIPANSKLAELTISVWMKTDSDCPIDYYIYDGIVSLYRNSNYPVVFTFDSSNNTSGSAVAHQAWCFSNAYGEILNNGSWHHLCYTVNKGILKAYVDGELISTIDKSSGGEYVNYRDRHTMGCNYNHSGSFYKGKLSDFRIYSTVLSDDEVKLLYSSPISVTNSGVLLSNSIEEN